VRESARFAIPSQDSKADFPMHKVKINGRRNFYSVKAAIKKKDAIHSMYLPRMSDAKWLNASIHWADLSVESFGANGMTNGAGESLLLASLNL